jgi:cell division protein FtsI/penicillin-binding protein 2
MKVTSKFHSYKLSFIFIGFLLVFVAILFSLAKWQFVDKDEFIALANERYREVKIPAVRGSILASDETTLTFSEPRFDFYVWKSELEDAENKNKQTREEFVRKVSEVLVVTEDEINEKLDSEQLWIKLGDRITVAQRDQLLALTSDKSNKELEGLRFEYVNSRNYPEGSLASHVLGFYGYNDFGEPVGVGGIEQFWDRSLRPIEGVSNSEVDSFGNSIFLGDNTDETEAKPGLTLVTTIDKNLQAILEKMIQDGFTDYQPKSITGIIMDPKTGAIMAMTNFPNFDPNTYYDEKDGNIFGNKAITTPYEIGSVAKIFTVSAALDLKKIEFDEVILPNGHRGCEVITPNDNQNGICNDSRIQCICTYDKKPVNQPINVIDAMVTSDNVAFRNIGGKLSSEEFHDYLVRFGVGKISGVDLTGESTGVLPDADKWEYADNAVYSYGHGYQMTPLQAITGVSVIANDGKRMQPYVVDRVLNNDGTSKTFESKELMQVIDEKVADTTAQLMRAVYKKSLSETRYQDLSEYNIGMKSGTALVPYRDKPGYSSEINATYVGFDNSPSKKFIMLIKIEEPQVGDLSFYNARMLWLDTFIAIKDYLAIPKDTNN